MNDYEIDELASGVAELVGGAIPVDLAHIAAEERIELMEGEFGADFHGRIEYLPEEGVFAIYHPSAAAEIFPGRIRFTIAHELGHYFIPDHRDLLLKYLVHDSAEDFRPNRDVERQADRFAAALLLPANTLQARMGRKGFLALKEIRTLAGDCGTSLQAAAFRYSQFTTEPHLAIVSDERRILYYFASEEAEALGFGGLGNRLIPAGSPTDRAFRIQGRDIEEGETNTELWFSERYRRAELWEESVHLGYAGRVLTLLSWQDTTSDDR